MLRVFFSFALIPVVNCFYSCFSVLVCCIIQVLLVFLQLSGMFGSTGEQLCSSPEREAEQEGLWTPGSQPGWCVGSCSSLQGAEQRLSSAQDRLPFFFAGCAARLEYQCRLGGEHLSFRLPVAPHSQKLRKANGLQSYKGVGLVGFNVHWILLLRNSILLTFPKRCFNFQSYKQTPTFAIIIYFFIYP